MTKNGLNIKRHHHNTLSFFLFAYFIMSYSDDDFDDENNDDFNWNDFWDNLSSNENAIEILEKYQDKINWKYLSGNKNAMNLLKTNPDYIDWDYLTSNENASDLLKKYFDENFDDINWKFLGKNKSKFAIDFIENNFEQIGHRNLYYLKHSLSMNESMFAMHFLKTHPTMIDWGNLSENKNAIDIIEKNIDFIDWSNLSKNENAMHILKANQKNINWSNLSFNKNAIDLLLENKKNIYFPALSENENAVDFLMENQDEINWEIFSENKNAVNFLKDNQDKIHWENFAKNTNQQAIPLLMEFVEQNQEQTYNPIFSSPQAHPHKNIVVEINKFYKLAHLPNCDVDERFEKWKRDGGTLLENKKLGCGINSLTFLGVFNRAQGEQIIKQISKGTSFIEMMNYVSLYNKNVAYQEIIFHIGNAKQIINFITCLKYFLPDNCCTIAKFNRNKKIVMRGKLTDGHSVVFSKTNNEITTIDPQLLTKRIFNETKEFVEKILNVWSKQQYYETVSLIFQPKTHKNKHIHKIKNNLKNLKPMTIPPNIHQSPMMISPDNKSIETLHPTNNKKRKFNQLSLSSSSPPTKTKKRKMNSHFNQTKKNKTIVLKELMTRATKKHT